MSIIDRILRHEANILTNESWTKTMERDEMMAARVTEELPGNNRGRERGEEGGSQSRQGG